MKKIAIIALAMTLVACGGSKKDMPAASNDFPVVKVTTTSADLSTSYPATIKGMQDIEIHPRIRIEEEKGVSFAVACRHCKEPLCVRGCISGALSIRDGVVCIDPERCVGCYTCVLCCPYGAVSPSAQGAVQKCELCTKNGQGLPACVLNCPNKAIVFEER